ncbi:MAG: aldehyde ferredoxin oxidoreductase N-terminal domain-containing protein [Chitinophagales bacterium]
MIDRGYIRILKIDLTTRTFEVKDRPDLNTYLGGVGLAAKLLDEEMDYTLEALDPGQPIVFAIGPMSTIFPVVTKVCCMFRSPLTGELGESYAGGRLAMAMLLAGYDALVIKGKAERPVYISVTSRAVSIKKADPMWGTTSEETGRYLREVEAGRGFRSTVRIGQAGEKLILYANLNVDTYRHFGRLGPGAIFGSKNLKALLVSGDKDYRIPKENYREYRKVYDEIYKRVTQTEVLEKYHDLGTPVNVLKLNSMNALPTRNLQQGQFDNAQEFSGESFAEERLVRKAACIGCPVGCIHIGQYRRLFGARSHEYETINLPYDHELIFALGTFLGTSNKDDFFAMLDKVEAYGLDVMSVGVALGWLTEAFQKGLVTEEQTMTRLDFGYVEGYLKAIDELVRAGNELYRDLGKGTEFAAKKYGGLEFAMALGKTEMTGYHTGYGAILGQAVGARHSHLDNAGYSTDQSRNWEERDEFVDAIFREEIARCVVNCLVICLFSRNIYDLDTVTMALNSIGMNRTKDELLELGKKIYRLKLEMKKKMNFDFRALRFPKRFFETPSLQGKLEEDVMQDLLQRYAGRVDEFMEEVPLDGEETVEKKGFVLKGGS